MFERKKENNKMKSIRFEFDHRAKFGMKSMCNKMIMIIKSFEMNTFELIVSGLIKL